MRTIGGNRVEALYMEAVAHERCDGEVGEDQMMCVMLEAPWPLPYLFAHAGEAGHPVGIRRMLQVAMCRIPYDHMVACETGAGGSGTNLSWPASAYCS